MNSDPSLTSRSLTGVIQRARLRTPTSKMYSIPGNINLSFLLFCSFCKFSCKHPDKDQEVKNKGHIFIFFPPLFPKSNFIRVRRTRPEPYINTGFLSDFYWHEFMREPWRRTYRIILFQPRCCLLHAGWENMSTGGIFLEALSILDRTETSTERRYCIPPSHANLGFKPWSLYPTRDRVLSLKWKLFSEKYELPSMEGLFHSGF